MRAATQQSLGKAKKDLEFAERIIDAEHLANMIAFHSQQTVEKCFKAIIEEYKIEFIKSYNLIELYEIIKCHLNFKIDIVRLRKLNDVYTDSRYPSLMGTLPEGIPGKIEADLFYKFALEIYNNIKALL